MDGVLIWGTLGTSGTSSLSRRGVQAPNPKTNSSSEVREGITVEIESSAGNLCPIEFESNFTLDFHCDSVESRFSRRR